MHSVRSLAAAFSSYAMLVAFSALAGHTHAQDADVTMGLNAPSMGARIRANWPGYSGGWARGYYIVNENNSANLFGLGVLGMAEAGHSTMSYGWIGPDHDRAWMSFLTNGWVGIGTVTPEALLTVGSVASSATTQLTGDLRVGNFGGSGVAYVQARDSGGANIDLQLRAQATGEVVDVMRLTSGGNVGIGTAAPASRLHVFASTTGMNTAQIQQENPGGDGLYVRTAAVASVRYAMQVDTGSVSGAFYVQANGNVGIGTTSPTHRLSVNGAVRAKEVIIDTGWADHVFDEGYRLTPLRQLGQQIRTEKHLPGIPSSADVAERGVNLGELQVKLLEKIEELTLHVIAQEQRISDLELRLAKAERVK